MDAFWLKAYLAIGLAFVGIELYQPKAVAEFQALRDRNPDFGDRAVYVLVSLACLWVVLVWPYFATQSILRTIFVKKS